VPNQISLAEEIFDHFVEEQDRFRGWATYWIDQIYDLDDTGIKCHFCEQRQHEVERLIASPLAYICTECVQLCVQILDEDVSS
jgi:ClpX C4-type zinc finger